MSDSSLVIQISIGVGSLCDSDCTGEVKAVPLLLTVFGGGVCMASELLHIGVERGIISVPVTQVITGCWGLRGTKG